MKTALLLLASAALALSTACGASKTPKAVDQAPREHRPGSNVQGDPVEANWNDARARGPGQFEEVSWRNGSRVDRAYVDPAEFAEFSPSEEGRMRILTLQPDARIAATHASAVRIWSLPGGVDVKDLLEQLHVQADPLRLSPVFRVGRGVGPRRALPGGVLVRLKAGIEPTEAQARLERDGYAVARVLELKETWLEVESDSGRAVFAAIERLETRDDVEQATPNWWIEIAGR